MRKFTYAIALAFALMLIGCEKESVADQSKSSSVKTDANATQNSVGCNHGDSHNPPPNTNY
jgi:hypothetical protein